MVRAIRAFLRRRFHVPGLFQIALVATGFAGLRLLQSPSTVTFFTFESALAVTLGIFLSGRVASVNHRSLPDDEDESDPTVDAYNPSSVSRLRSLAVRLGLSPAGGVEDLQHRIKSEMLLRRRNSVQVETAEEEFGGFLVDRIASRAELMQVPRSPSEQADYLGSLAEEGSNLLLLAKDLELRSRFYRRVLREARGDSEAGSVETAITLLENGNRRLRTRLVALITRELREFHPGSSRPYLVLSSVSFILMAMALWVLSTGLYIAPPAFYILVAGAAGALVLNTQSSGNQRPIGVLLQIVILAALLKFHFFYLNPYLYTSDTFFHFLGLEGIASTGHIPDLGHYSYFPGYHVFGFVGVSVAGLPLAWYGIFAFLAQLITIPTAYLIGREVADHRVGLYSAILTMFSVFFFLPVIPLPSLFGFVFLFLALYALVRVRRAGWQVWFVVFWISALGAFFSHAITALVLLLALVLRFMHLHVLDRKALKSRPVATPALSYGVVYGGYMAFIAFVSFELFVRTIFSPTYAPALATAPAQTLQTTAAYVLQSALAPLSIAILFFFAAYGMLSSHGISTSERRFLVLLGFAFVLIPAVEVVSENFRAQSTRFLSYMTIPFVLIGAHGAVSASRLIRGRRRAATVLVSAFTVFAFVGASSYLTNNDVRYLYDAIPAIPTHITDSALSSRNFLALAEEGTLVYMDFGSWIYFYEDSGRARNALFDLETKTLDQLNQKTGQAYVILNDDFLPYGNPYLGILYDGSAVHRLLENSQASRLFDAGKVRVYLTP